MRGDRFVLTRVGRVVERLLDQPVLVAPRGRPLADPAGGGRVDRGELQLEQLAEEMVVAVPLAVRVERDEEAVAALQLPQPLGGVGAAEHRVAERCAEASEHRGLEQEAAGVPVERVEHLAGEVVGDVPVVAVERAHAGLRLGQPAQPQRGEVEPRRPALGSLHEQRDVLVVEGDGLALDEQLARLVESERELGGADLGERAARAQPPERERGIGARRRHDARVRRQVLDRVLERGEALVVAEHVQVVQHDGERLPVGRDAVHELVHGDGRRHARCAEPCERHPAEARPDPVDRRRDVRPEPRRVVVARIERDPRDGGVGVRAPRLREHRLAEADRRVDQRQRRGREAVERGEQPLPDQPLRLQPARARASSRSAAARRGRSAAGGCAHSRSLFKLLRPRRPLTRVRSSASDSRAARPL